MSAKSAIIKGILYYTVSLAALALTFANPVLFFLLVPIAAAFAFSASCYIPVNPAVVLAAGGALSYLISGNLWYAGFVIVFSCILVIVFKLASVKKSSLVSTVGWGALVSSVSVAGLFVLMLYVTKGSVDLSMLTDPIRKFGNDFISQSKESLVLLGNASGISESELNQLVSGLNEQYRNVIDSIINSLPGLYIELMMILTFLSHLLSKGLSANHPAKPLNCEGLFDIRLPGLFGLAFILSYILMLFVSGTAYVVALNYATIFELPLIAEGIGVIYFFFTNKWKKPWVKVVVILGIVFTLCNFIIDLSWIFLCVGAMDTYTDFRGRIKNRTNKN